MKLKLKLKKITKSIFKRNHLLNSLSNSNKKDCLVHNPREIKLLNFSVRNKEEANRPNQIRNKEEAIKINLNSTLHITIKMFEIKILPPNKYLYLLLQPTRIDKLMMK